ncbi:MAG: hypothetical protein AB1611_21820 [bacterium]
MRDSFYYSRKAANLPYPQFNQREEAGYILIISSCLISFTLILLAAGYLSLQANQVYQLEREICSIRAFYIAQAGLKKIARDPDALQKNLSQEPWLGSFGEDETYQGEKVPDSNPVRIVVSGACRTEDGHIVRRILEATLSPGRRELPFTLPAVYVESEPSFAVIPGDIYGKCLDIDKNKYSLAIQSAGRIRNELFYTIPTYFHDEFISFLTLGCNQGVNCRSEDNYYRKMETRHEEEGNGLRLLLPTTTNAALTKSPLLPGRDPEYDWYYHDATNNIEYRGTAGNARGTGARAEVVVNHEYNLSEGNYYLTRLELRPDARLKGTGKVKIFCVGDMLLGKNSQIGDPNHIGNLTILGYSIGDNPQFRLQENCRVYGSILAPGCELLMQAGVDIRGGIVAWSMTNDLQGSSRRPWKIAFDPAFEEAVSESVPSSGASLLANWRERRAPN